MQAMTDPPLYMYILAKISTTVVALPLVGKELWPERGFHFQNWSQFRAAKGRDLRGQIFLFCCVLRSKVRICIRTVRSQLLLCSDTFDSFLAGLRRKSSVCTVHVALPKRPMNQFQLVQQSRQQALKAYCPEIHIYLLWFKGQDRKWIVLLTNAHQSGHLSSHKSLNNVSIRTIIQSFP